MPTLHVKSYRSISSASIELPGPGETVVLVGPNGAGKSSLCQAAACVLLRDPSVLGRTKADREARIRDESRSGSVQLADRAGAWLAKLPSGEASQQGRTDGLPTASAVASGMVRPAAMPAKERAAVLVSTLRAEPGEAEWIKACADVGVATESRDGDDGLPAAKDGWDQISGGGWDGAARAFARSATQAKGGWCEATGSRAYGDKIATKWQPEGFDGDLLNASPSDARAACLTARSTRDDAIKAGASAARDQARIDEIEAKLLSLAVEKDQTHAALVAAGERAAKARAALDKAPSGRFPTIRSCPHDACAKDIEIVGHGTGSPGLRLPEPAAKGSVDLIGMREEDGLARAGLDGAQSRVTTLAARIETLTEERDRRAELPERAGDPAALARAENALALAEAYGKAVVATQRAARLHAEVQVWTALAQLAGPEGLRQRKLGEVLELVNGGLAELSAAMGCGPVAIGAELDITLAGRSYELLSQSERWRVDAIVAIELARRDGSAMVVLDGADVLDNQGRRGLFEAIYQAEVAALVAMTTPRAQAEAMARGLVVLWVDRGAASLIEPPAEEAA